MAFWPCFRPLRECRPGRQRRFQQAGNFCELRPTSFSTTGVKKRVLCRDVSFGRTGAVPAPSDTAEALRLPCLRLCVLHHQGRAVLHDGVAYARGRPEMCQLRHDGHRLALARGGQALRLRGARKLSLAPRRLVAPVRHPWAFRTDPPGPSLCPYSPECVEGFSLLKHSFALYSAPGSGAESAVFVVFSDLFRATIGPPTWPTATCSTGWLIPTASLTQKDLPSTARWTHLGSERVTKMLKTAPKAARSGPKRHP